jgi:hypothetical protein
MSDPDALKNLTKGSEKCTLRRGMWETWSEWKATGPETPEQASTSEDGETKLEKMRKAAKAAREAKGQKLQERVMAGKEAIRAKLMKRIRQLEETVKTLQEQLVECRTAKSELENLHQEEQLNDRERKAAGGITAECRDGGLGTQADEVGGSVAKRESERIRELVLCDILENREVGCKFHRHWKDTTIALCFALYTTSPAAYKLMKRMMILPSVSRVLSVYGKEVRRQQKTLEKIKQIPELVKQWRRKYGLEDRKAIDVILGIDAASMKPEWMERKDEGEHPGQKLPNGQINNNFFVFLVMPYDPALGCFTAHVRAHCSGALGSKLSAEVIRDVKVALGDEGIIVRALATDGDRSYVSDQDSLFLRYKRRLKDLAGSFQHPSRINLDSVNIDELWWICDVLHALKCQRCRLKDLLGLRGKGPTICAEMLNAILNLPHCLKDISGVSKMNDVLAVELFSFESLQTLLDRKEYLACYYFAPFVFWYGAISIVGLSRETRLSMLKLAFWLLAGWYEGYPMIGRGNYIVGSEVLPLPEAPRKFFAEECDLRRYMNTIVFVYNVLKVHDEIACNRMGTHPVENLFGLVRVASKSRHEWKIVLSVIAKAGIVDEILCLHGMKSHVRREMGIGGIKMGKEYHVPGIGEECEIVNWVGDENWWVLNPLQAVSKVSKADMAKVWSFFGDQVGKIVEWKKEKHFVRLYQSGPVANQTVLSRILTFGENGQKFRWSKKKRLTAVRIRKTVSEALRDEGLAARDIEEAVVRTICDEVGCRKEDVDRLFRKIEWGEIKVG